MGATLNILPRVQIDRQQKLSGTSTQSVDREENSHISTLCIVEYNAKNSPDRWEPTCYNKSNSIRPNSSVYIRKNDT
jgi:hypothetical protein